MRDRLDAVGGTVTVESVSGMGTTVTAVVPRTEDLVPVARSSPSPARRVDVHARIAWVVVGLTTLAAILDTVFTAAHRSLLSEATWADHGWPLAPLAGVGCALMGALIISRYPRHPLGWLLCVASLLSVTLAADAYSIWVLDGGGPGSASLGPCGRLGVTAAGLARLHRADPGLPPLPRRPPALTPMALGSLGHGGRPRPAHPGHVDRPPWRVRVRAGVRLPQHLAGRCSPSESCSSRPV